MHNHSHSKIYSDIKIEKKEKSKIVITGTISWDNLAHMRDHVLFDMKNNLELPGFRKGKVPEDVIVKKFGMMSILEEASEHAIKNSYPEILEENKLDVIGRPEVSIIKLAENNPLEFKIETTLLPEVKLADYKSIAKKENEKMGKEKNEVSEKEIDTAILDARKNLAKIKSKDKEIEIKESELPPLTDESVKEFGNFSSIKDLKEKVREGLIREKDLKSKEKNRLAIVDGIVSKSEIEIPDILIESEIAKIEAGFNDDVSRMGIKVDEYLKHIKKTMEDLRKDWKAPAEKKAKLQMCLNKIAETEKISAPEDEVKKETDALIKHYKDADPLRARIYIETVITNEKVFDFLENQK